MPSQPRKKAAKKPAQRAKPKEADPAEVEEWAAEAKESAITCRLDNHRWKRQRIFRYPISGIMEWMYRCTECRKVKYITTTDPENTGGRRIRRIGNTRYEPLASYDRKGKGRITADGKDILRYEQAMRSHSIIQVVDEEEA